MSEKSGYFRGSALRRYAQRLIENNKKQQNTNDIQQSRKSRNESIETRKNRTKTINTQTISHDQRNIQHKYYQSGLRLSTVPSNSRNLQTQIAIQQKKALQQICKHKPKSRLRYDLMPLKNIEPVRLMRRSSSSSSYLSLASSRTKLTDRLFSQIDNIRMVEKLLLVKPTKYNSTNQLNQFYKQQQKYKKNIQISKSVPFKRSNIKNKPWVHL